MLKNMDYVSYPLPEDIERLVAFGDFDRARRLIDLRMKSEKTPEALRKRLAFELHIIEEIPKHYPHSEEQAFALLRALIRDFTREEMERLRDEGTLDWIYIGGKVFYKDDIDDCVVKTRPELAERIDPARLRSRKENARALSEIIARMKEKGGVRMRFCLRTTLRIEKEAQEPGKRVRVHMPLPLSDSQCRPVSIRTQPSGAHIAAENAPQRTACFEAIYEPDMSFTTESVYEIRAPYVEPKPEEVCAEQPHFDTEEMLPQIRFTPFIRALAAELKGEETNPLIIARRFYDYVTTNTCYRYVPPYFTKTNIPEYFAAGQRGDCGMYALLFITLCRCVGIPARWQAGLYARPGDVGMHDWAKFYVAPYGWLFVDGSFGGAAYREGDMERWNFYFGNLDPYRFVANSDFQQELDPPFPFMRADPYDNQRGEVMYDDHALRVGEFTNERTMVSWEEIDE